jgi:hypothetical protein
VPVSKKTPYVDIPPKPTASKPSRPECPQTTQSAAPQFKYSSPLEAGVSSNNVVQKILSQQVSLTVAEAIALCPEVRKFFKEGTTTRRIPTVDAPTQANMVSTFYLAPDEEEELVEGAHSLPLRTLQVSLNEEITAMAIIDSGCQIIIMRLDIWEKLGLPLLPDHIMVLELANGKSNAMKGMLPRVTFRVGEIRLPCPVQVIEEAPFEVLLGRPFTALAEANIQEFRNGEIHVKLKDPNTGLVQQFPTKGRADRKKVKANTVGV